MQRSHGSSRTGYRTSVRPWRLKLAAGMILAAMGVACVPPDFFLPSPLDDSDVVLRNADGEPITTQQIEEVLTDPDLETDEERADALRELGITDEDLIALLIQNADEF